MFGAHRADSPLAFLPPILDLRSEKWREDEAVRRFGEKKIWSERDIVGSDGYNISGFPLTSVPAPGGPWDQGLT